MLKLASQNREANLFVTQNQLKEYYYYCEETGIFTRIKDQNYNAKAGQTVGFMHDGYMATRFKCRRYFLHILAWIYVYGEAPGSMLDHIDTDKTNNRISNLRKTTYSLNKANTDRRCDATNEFKGVCFVRGKFHSYIGFEKTQIYLGVFSEIEEAFLVRQAAEIEIFGEFRRQNH